MRSLNLLTEVMWILQRYGQHCLHFGIGSYITATICGITSYCFNSDVIEDGRKECRIQERFVLRHKACNSAN